MKLSSYLDEKLIFENLDGNSIEEVINVLVNKVAKVNKTVESYKNLIEDAILKREHKISTAIGKGIAIPHARVDEYNDVLVVIGKLKNPIDNKVEATHTMDKVDLVFVIIAGRTKNKTVLKQQEQSKEFLKKDSLLNSKQKDSLVKEFNSKNAEKKENYEDSGDIIIRGKSTEAKNFAYYLKKGEDTISSLKISGDATFEYKNFWNNFKIKGESSRLKNEKTIQNSNKSVKSLVQNNKETIKKKTENNKNVKEKDFTFSFWIFSFSCFVIIWILIWLWYKFKK